MASPSSSSTLDPRSSLMRRVVVISSALLVAFLLAGALMTYESLRLQRLTANFTAVLQVRAVTSKTLIDLTQLDSILQQEYPAHNSRSLSEKTSPWIAKLKDDAQNLQTLEARLPQDAPLRKATHDTIPALNQIAFLTNGILSQAEIGNWASARFRKRALEHTETLVRPNLERILVRADEYSRQHYKTISKTLRLMGWVPIFITIVGLLFLLGSLLLMQRAVVRPLEILTHQIERFTSGDFSLRVSLNRHDEIGQLAHTFNVMADRIQRAHATLADKVEERTRALQRRTTQLQAATEIGRAVATIKDLDEMLREAARLISQRYGFYHVAIFLTEGNNQRAVIRAAYTQRGQAADELLRKHLTVFRHDESAVGQALTTEKPQTRQFPDNAYPLPELQATRTELALPLKSGDQLLGVLNVHTPSEEALTPEEITALQIVADLLAVAITNTYLLNETQSALETARRAYEEISQKGWQRFLRFHRVVGYRLETNGQIRPVAQADKRKTASSTPPSKTATATAPLEKAPSQKNLHEYRFSVNAHGRTIAVAHLRKPTPWSPPEKRLLARLSDRLGSALESARLYAEAQRRAAQLQIAAEIARDTSSTLDLDSLLTKAVNLVRERFGFYHASVFLLDESGEYAYVKESTGEAGRQLKARRHRLAVGSASIVGQTIARKSPVVVNNVAQSDIHHFNPLLPDTQAEMGIPLRAGDELIGALDIQSTFTNAFSEEDIAVLQILADQLAIAVVNARLFAETQEHLTQHRDLHQITASAVSATSVEEAIRNAVESLHATRPSDAVALLVPAADQPQTLQVAAHAGHGMAADAFQHLRIAFGENIPGRAAATQQPFLVGDIHTAEGNEPLAANMRSELAIPLVYRDELLGVLDIENPSVNAYDEHDLEMMRTLANSLAAVIANIRLLEEVRRHSNELELLYEITAAVASEVDLDKLLDTLVHHLQQGLELLHCGVVLFDRNGETGTLVASASAEGAPGAGMVGAKIPLDSPSIQEALQTRKPVVFRDIYHDERLANIRSLLEQRGTRQLVVLPLMARDEVIGTLGLDIAEPDREISEDDLRLLEQIAHQIATSVEVARLFRQAVRTADRERTVTEITTKMRASNDPQAVLQTAIEELRKALHAQQTQVVFVESDGNNAPPQGV